MKYRTKYRKFLSIIISSVALFLVQPGRASNPNWPDNIDDDADLSIPANMPDDWSYYNERYEDSTLVRVGGQWNLWSFIPQLWIDTGDPIRAEEIALGTGMHADRAWLLTPGRRDVIVAVLDSGARWHNVDLVNKYYLNPGELDRAGARPCVPEGYSGDPLDVNADGIFNIEDYATGSTDCAFDIDDEGNDNDLIDPQDLLLSTRYSDGVDDDGNGYIDDISGWDFFWNDNDAFDQTDFGHGNGEASDSCAEGNNGHGGIGVCPECTVLMIRAGDSFLVDANDFADGVVFAVDSGASVIQEALGSINNTPFAQQAMEYAYDNNVVVIASAADELSYHHNMPGTNNHTVYVHAVVHDSGDRARSTTFLNYNNCTNHGGQLVLSTPGNGCSSEATGKSAGHAGLIYSYALDQALDPPLSAEELRGLMVMSVDDINVPESNPDHEAYDDTKFPSGEGWDFHFGYGRNNARASLELIRDGEVPPEVDIVDPLWFETIYPDETTTTVTFTGRVGARVDGLPPRYASYDYVIAVAQGADPEDDDYWQIAQGTTASMDGALASANLADFDSTGVPQDPHEFAATVRLRACVTGSGSFGAGGTCSEFRKTFFVHEDPDLYDAFPIYLGASGESSPVFFDLDGDGDDELILPTTDGLVHAFQADGSELEGWPAELGGRKGHRDDMPNDHRTACAYRPSDDRGTCTTRGHVDPDVLQTSAVGSPGVANLEGDEGGDGEVIVTSYDGFVYAFQADGTPVSGFPVRTNPEFSQNTDRYNTWDEGIAGAPALYDLDGDDDLEIIVAAMDQHVYVWHHNGELMDGWPVYCRDLVRDTDPDLTRSLGARIFASPAVGDIDQDGHPEILVGTNEVYDDIGTRFYIMHWDGNEHEDGPFEWVDPDEDAPGPFTNYALIGEVLPVVGRGIPAAATLADVDYDGYIEFTVEGIGGQPTMRRWDGFEVLDTRYMNISTEAFGENSDVTDNFTYTLINQGAFGYMDNSGDLAFLKGGAGIDFALAFAEGGRAARFVHQLGGWNVRTGMPLKGFPRVIEDWQFFVSPTIVDLDNDRFPEVLTGSGGYLLRAFDWQGTELEGWPKLTGGWIVSSAAVGDFDGDEYFDVATMTRNGWVFVWRTEGRIDSIVEWNGFGHDNQNTFNYEHPIPEREVTQLEPLPEPDPAEAVDSAEAVDDMDEPMEVVPDAGLDTELDIGLDDDETGSVPDETTPPTIIKDEGCCSVAQRSTPNRLDLLAIAALAVLVFRRRKSRIC